MVPLCTDLLTLVINPNFATRNEHVPEIERQHCVIKERARVCRHSLPLKVLQRIMLVEMVKNCALWLNMFPSKGGIGSVSPRTLITGIKLDYKKHCQLPFGYYVQVHEEPTPTNSPEAQTIGAITLRPTGNLQGGYTILNLQTGKKIIRRNWTHLPMPIEVIKRVNQLGKEKNQPAILTFQDHHGHSTMDQDPYFQPVDIDIEGVIPDPDEQDPNLHDENNAEDEIK